MSRLAHPRAMQPVKPGRTRTAPPRLPDRFPFEGRYLRYLLFGATGIVYLLLGIVALGLVWALGSGEAAWSRGLETLRSPVYVAFHAIALASVCFVAVRFFGFFPKAQPPRIGPARPPPRPVLQGMLYGIWLGVTALFAAILAGGIF